MDRRRGLDVGGLVFGAILLVVGGYYLLRNTFGLSIPELNWDLIWPLLVIGLGVAVLYGVWNARSGASHGG